MRIAIVSRSARRVGGVEDYLSMVMPAMHSAGSDVAFWHEIDTPSDRDRIQLPLGTPDICAAEVGVDASIQQLREWKPHVLYVQGIQDVAAEAKLLEIAPAVFFLQTYTATCISGSKTFTRPIATACDRKFGAPCLLHYFPHGCGGHNPATMWRLFAMQSRRLRLFRNYAAILTISDHMRDEMAKHGLHASVVPYPFRPQTSSDAKRPDDAETKQPDRAWHLLYAGRMESLKGGHVLIEALPDVARAARRRVRMTFAGDGSDRRRWEALAQRIQAATPNLTIEFTGWLTQQDVGTLMRKADLLVLPSLWPEPFGAVGPAAGQYGVPAAAFASGGISQWLGDGVSGHLAPANPPMPSALAAAIVRCLEDPAHYQALRTGARQMAARFTMDRHLPPVVAALDRVKRANGSS
jgi:glycosyltransferase involved in cell wall biosynthesis